MKGENVKSIKSLVTVVSAFMLHKLMGLYTASEADRYTCTVCLRIKIDTTQKLRSTNFFLPAQLHSTQYLQIMKYTGKMCE